MSLEGRERSTAPERVQSALESLQVTSGVVAGLYVCAGLSNAAEGVEGTTA